MPVFNDVKFIEASLDSILNQTFKDFVLIISDDGSTDGSGGICKMYAENHSNIKYIRQQKNLGISKNMEFLLAQAVTPYFMWAGDDDLMSPDFIETLVREMDNNIQAVSAFCSYRRIDDHGDYLTEIKDFDYSGVTPVARVRKLLKNPDDIFGYGLMRTERIRAVRFPNWWWPVRKHAYNNIFPSLCFYLTSGPYIHVSGPARFFKRNKSQAKMNHSLKKAPNGVIESVEYFVRRFYLSVFSINSVRRASNLKLALRLAPAIFYRWFLVSSFQHMVLAIRAQKRKLPLK